MNYEKFFKFVSKTIPNPPFAIQVKNGDEVNQHTSDSFFNISSEFYKDLDWRNYNYIKQYELDISDSELGLSGKAFIGILEKNKMPVKNIEVASRDVTISGLLESFTLKTAISVDHNSISKSTQSIEIDEDEQVNTSTGTSKIMSSKSKLSLHGIEIPMNLFPSYWTDRNQLARLDWPFPAYIVVDINGKRDIDLNSARTEVTYNEKWIDFAETLSYVVCKELSKQVSTKYWNNLKDMCIKNTKDENFKRGLLKVTK
jgi:molecular chaperone HtpG